MLHKNTIMFIKKNEQNYRNPKLNIKDLCREVTSIHVYHIPAPMTPKFSNSCWTSSSRIHAKEHIEHMRSIHFNKLDLVQRKLSSTPEKTTISFVEP